MKVAIVLVIVSFLLSGCGGKTVGQIKAECWDNVYNQMSFDLKTETGRQAANSLYEACVDGKIYNN